MLHKEIERPSLTIGQKVADIIITSGCLQFGEFITASGFPAFMKVDIDYLLANKEKMNEVNILLCEMIRNNVTYIDLIVGVPRGGVYVANEISPKLRVDTRVRPIRPQGKYDGPQVERYEQKIGNASRIIVLEDVVTAGTSSGRTIREIANEADKSNILAVASIYTYGFKPEVEGVPVWSLCTFEDLMESLSKRPAMSGWVPKVREWHTQMVENLK